MDAVRIRNHNQIRSRLYRFEPLKNNRLAAALALLIGFATVSVMAGTQAASQKRPEQAVILLQR